MSSDFDKFLYELDITEKQLINWMNDQDVNNLTEIESDYYFKKKSKVHGIGVFSNKDFCKFDYIEKNLDVLLTVLLSINN